MLRFALAFIVAAGAGLVASAQSTDAPLENTKQQLQSLGKDRAAEKAGTQTTPATLRGALTTPEAIGPMPLPSLLPAQKKEERDAIQKAGARKNWLLDGYDKLSRPKDDKHAGTGNPDAEEANEPPLNPSDPDYFLRVYEKQRAETLARQKETSAASESRIATGSDAFAPFLKDWLAGSPVRDALSEVAVGSAGTGRVSASASDGLTMLNATPERRESRASSTGFDAGGETKAASAANPFVLALGLPTTPPAQANDLRPPTAPAEPPPVSSSSSDWPTREAEKPVAPRVIVPPPQDAKKYFPQLKKF